MFTLPGELMAAALADPMVPEAYVLRQVEQETPDTFTLTFQPDHGGEAAGFAPGQFSMLWVFGVGEMPISISGDPADRGHLVYTVRSVGHASRALAGGRPGAAIGVRGPFGVPWPVEPARGRDVLVVAGGIGLAPLRSVIYRVLRQREDYGRLVVLYGARSPRDLLYRKELTAWARQPRTQVLVTVDYGGLSWRRYVGVVTTLLKYARFQPSSSTAMICGPEVMMRFVARELEDRGLSRGDIYLSLERNMRCAVGFCGHCQLGPFFVCRDGPVFSYQRVRPLLEKNEL